MRLILRIALLSVFTVAALSAHAQLEKLFAPYDCRVHSELTIDEPITDTLSIVSTQALAIEEPELTIVMDTVNAWQNWRTIKNYTFGKDRGDMPMIVELDALHPYFRDKITQLIKTCKGQGIELAVVESYRTHAKQHEYKSMGSKYTRSGAGKSKHQYGLAVDLVPIVDSVAVWDNIALWKKIGVTGEKLGLRWGGRWKKPYDPGHFEWTGGVTTAQLSKGLQPNISKDLYPCMEEDLRILQRYWKEWELSQSSFARK